MPAGFWACLRTSVIRLLQGGGFHYVAPGLSTAVPPAWYHGPVGPIRQSVYREHSVIDLLQPSPIFFGLARYFLLSSIIDTTIVSVICPGN